MLAVMRNHAPGLLWAAGIVGAAIVWGLLYACGAFNPPNRGSGGWVYEFQALIAALVAFAAAFIVIRADDRRAREGVEDDFRQVMKLMRKRANTLKAHRVKVVEAMNVVWDQKTHPIVPPLPREAFRFEFLHDLSIRLPLRLGLRVRGLIDQMEVIQLDNERAIKILGNLTSSSRPKATAALKGLARKIEILDRNVGEVAGLVPPKRAWKPW